jgi:hypothetical protein
MALLVFSDKCSHSLDVISFIRSHPALIQIVRFHNVNTHGVPSKKIVRVPTLVTNDGQMLVGAEVKTWLTNTIPCEFENFESTGPSTSNFDGSEEASGSMFGLDRYGETLQPILTPELEEKIGRNVSEAYQSFASK